jgi:methionine synthase II (cobalamin-independent)
MSEAIHGAVDPHEPFIEDMESMRARVEEAFTQFTVKQVATVPYGGLGEPPMQEVVVPVIDPNSFMLTKPA